MFHRWSYIADFFWYWDRHFFFFIVDAGQLTRPRLIPFFFWLIFWNISWAAVVPRHFSSVRHFFFFDTLKVRLRICQYRDFAASRFSPRRFCARLRVFSYLHWNTIFCFARFYFFFFAELRHAYISFIAFQPVRVFSDDWIFSFRAIFFFTSEDVFAVMRLASLFRFVFCHLDCHGIPMYWLHW